VDTQERAFTLLEGRQRPEQIRDLYLVDTLSYALSTAYYHLRLSTSSRMIVLFLTRAVEHAKELARILSGQGY